VNETAANIGAKCRPMTRAEMAARVACDVPEGWYVNLGIGAPLQVADYVPPEREVIFHSENGVLGMGPRTATSPTGRFPTMTARRRSAARWISPSAHGGCGC